VLGKFCQKHRPAAHGKEIIEHYSSNTAAAPDVPPSGIFTFGNELWDSSEEAVGIEDVQGETGYPKADDFGTFDDNRSGYSHIPTETNTVLGDMYMQPIMLWYHL
jgi:hypothetical protein